MQSEYASNDPNDQFKDEALPFIMFNPDNKRKLIIRLTCDLSVRAFE
jgi:hypothetical protein